MEEIFNTNLKSVFDECNLVEKTFFWPHYNRFKSVYSKKSLQEFPDYGLKIRSTLTSPSLFGVGCLVSALLYVLIIILMTTVFSNSKTDVSQAGRIVFEVIGLFLVAFYILTAILCFISFKLFQSNQLKLFMITINSLLPIFLSWALHMSSQLTILFKIMILRAIALLPLVRNCPAFLEAFQILATDAGILAIIIFQPSQDSNTSQHYLPGFQNSVVLVAYGLAFLSKIVLDFSSIKLRKKVALKQATIYEMIHAHFFFIDVLKGPPQATLRLQYSQNEPIRMRAKLMNRTGINSVHFAATHSLREGSATKPSLQRLAGSSSIIPVSPASGQNRELEILPSATPLREASDLSFKPDTPSHNTPRRSLTISYPPKLLSYVEACSEDLQSLLDHIIFTTQTSFEIKVLNPGLLAEQTSLEQSLLQIVDTVKGRLCSSLPCRISSVWEAILQKILAQTDCFLTLSNLNYQGESKNIDKSSFYSLAMISYFCKLENKREIALRVSGPKEQKFILKKEAGSQKSVMISTHKNVVIGESSERKVLGKKVPTIQDSRGSPVRSIFRGKTNTIQLSIADQSSFRFTAEGKDTKNLDHSDDDWQPFSQPNITKENSSIAPFYSKPSLKPTRNYNSIKSTFGAHRPPPSDPQLMRSNNSEYPRQSPPNPRSVKVPAESHFGPNPSPLAPDPSPSPEELISVVVHDMRSPLNSIIGNLELIKSELATSENDQLFALIQPLLKSSIASSSLLESLISDILDSARIARGIFTVNPEAFSPQEVVKECTEIISIAARARKNEVKYEFDGIEGIYSDKYRLKQVLLNLLSNSLKFTHKGTITVKVNRKDRLTHFSVEDTGVGMTPEVSSKMFEKFASQRESKHNSKGIGIGLFICKSIIETLGPKRCIGVQSEVGKGTKISFDLFTHYSDNHTAFMAPLPTSENMSSSAGRFENPETSRKEKKSTYKTIFDLNIKGTLDSQRVIEVRKERTLGDSSKFLHSISRSTTMKHRGTCERKKTNIFRKSMTTKRKSIAALRHSNSVEMEEDPINDPNVEKELTIMIVDDDPMLLQLFVDFTQVLAERLSIDMKVDSADTVEEGVSLMKASEYNIVVVDFNLPDGTGVDIVKQCQSSVPPLFILSTGEGEDSEILKIKDLFFEILHKPVSMSIWGEMLKKCLTKLKVNLQKSRTSLDSDK